MENNNKIGLALLWPFGGLISSLRNWRQPWAMNVFWVVCIYLGAIQIFCPAGHVLGDGADGGRYALKLIEMHGSHRGLLEQIAYDFAETGSLDYYQIILTWIVSLFTDNAHVLFACFAAVFGFFYSRNMWYVLNKTSASNAVITIFICILFLVCPIWEINGVRMWTATQILMYAILPYLWEGNKKRLIWLAAVPFVHFSYLYLVVISFAVILLPERINSNSRAVTVGLTILMVLSLIVGSMNISAITNFIETISPESYQDRVEMYTSESSFDRMVDLAGSVNWYFNASRNIKIWVANIFLLIFSLRKFPKSCERKLLNYCLLITSFANIAMNIPSGGRFIAVAHLFSYSLIIWQLCLRERQVLPWLSRIASIALLIPVFFGIRRGFDFYGLSLFCGNFLTSLVWDNNVPFIDYIKQMF